MLEALAKKYHLPIPAQFDVSDRGSVEALTDRALANGSEGLILKKRESLYEYGQQSNTWLQMKGPRRTLHTVLMYAHSRQGRRSGDYAAFTLGIRVAEDERYEETFIPIGKTHSGLADAEMEALNSRIEELTVEKYGPTLGLVPEVVIEVTFDAIQMNKRTKANYTLKEPQFKIIRWDLGPDDADTLSEVERIVAAKLNRKQRKQKGKPAFYFY
jgi:DNA ligase-1